MARAQPNRPGTGRQAPASVERDGTAARRTPHRPSRRDLIIDAAITVFARKGFSDASIQDVADEAAMVPTAIYYHFSGKEELFESALRRAMDEGDAVVSRTRPDDAPGDPESLRRVTIASWTWTEANPDKARLLFLHMPGGATPGAKLLRQDYEDRHVRRAYDYFDSSRVPSTRRSASAKHASRTLAVRTMIGLSMGIQPLRMEGGPLASLDRSSLQKALSDVNARLMTEE
jgi:AcrR family transcriptional regulator